MVENPTREGLRDCPFRTGNCIASNCMIWIGKHNRNLDEDIGHCAIVKTHQSLIAIETILTVFLVLLLISVIMTLGPWLFTVLFIQLNL